MQNQPLSFVRIIIYKLCSYEDGKKYFFVVKFVRMKNFIPVGIILKFLKFLQPLQYVSYFNKDLILFIKVFTLPKLQVNFYTTTQTGNSKYRHILQLSVTFDMELSLYALYLYNRSRRTCLSLQMVLAYIKVFIRRVSEGSRQCQYL